MKRLVSFTVLTALLLLASQAYGLGGGTSSADFLKIGVGARPSAMGEAFAAVADDPNACYWNPAGITSIDRWSITAMHLIWFQNTSYEYASAIMPVDPMTDIGLSANLFTVPSFNSTIAFGQTASLIPAADASYDLAVNLTVAKNFGNFYTKDFTIGNISLGANITYIKRVLTGVDLDTQWFFDVGAIANITDAMKLGIVLQDMGGALAETDPSPFNLRIGLSNNFNFSPDFSILGAFDINKPIDLSNPDYQKWFFNAGAEIKLVKFLFLRAGYKMNKDDQSYTAGGGFDLGWASADFAYMPHTGLGSTYRFSVTGRFGAAVARPVVGAPQPPQKTTAISGDKVVSVGWDPNPEANIIGYNIYYKEKRAGKYNKLNKEPVMEEAKFRAVLSNDVTYSFVVTAINNRNLESVYSTAVEATPQKYTAKKPARVEGVMAKIDAKTIVVTWNETKDDSLAGFNLYYKKESDVKYKRLNQNILRETKATLAGLMAKTKYYFMVTAVSKDGLEGDYSEPTSAQLPEDEYY